MPSVLLVYRRRSDVARAFRAVVDEWDLSAAEAAAVAGEALPPVRPMSARRLSDFVLERMALAVEIDALLTSLMPRGDIPGWLRRRVPGIPGACPLDDMFGSSDRLRRIVAMLEAEVRQ